MRIEGYVLEVMESMPLQLAVKSESTRIFVHLLLETTITQRGTPVGPGVIRPGIRIRIEGPGSVGEGMAADSIEILD